MKRVYLSFLVLLFAIFQLSAQTYKVVYEYDHAGNRVSRVVISINTRAKSVDDEISPLEQELMQCKIRVFPNPTKGFLNMEISSGEENCCYDFTLYSSSGQKLLNEKQIGNGNVSLDLSTYSTGIYILILKYGEEVVQYKSFSSLATNE